MNRHPTQIALFPTRDRKGLQTFLQCSARFLMRFAPAERTGWLVYLLEEIEALHLSDDPRHILFLLDDLRADIAERIATGSW